VVSSILAGDEALTDVLNLGAGNHPAKDAVNHDLHKYRSEIDVVHDLNRLPWPWEDNSFDLILASSVFEHLEITLVQALDECWRILRPEGCVRVKVPHWKHDNAYADPTHRWVFSPRVFDVFVPDTRRGSELGFYTNRKWSYVKEPRLNDQKSSIIVVMQVRKQIE